MGGTLCASFIALDWRDVAEAATQAATVARSGSRATQFLTGDEAAEVDAICGQIIPTDATPGAREAGVVLFVDRALLGFYAHQAGWFRSGLMEFQDACRKSRPQAGPFSSWPSAQQIEFLHTVDRTAFFEVLRQLTVMGMFSMPSYGGNRDGVGWKLLGFEDLHAFQPPFGYYDRDYPGFAADPPAAT